MNHIEEMSLEEGINYYEKTKSGVPRLIEQAQSVCNQALAKRGLKPNEDGQVLITNDCPAKPGEETPEDLVGPCLEVLGHVIHNLQEAKSVLEEGRSAGSMLLRQKRDAFDMVDDHLKELQKTLESKSQSSKDGLEQKPNRPKQIRSAQERTQEELALLAALIQEKTLEGNSKSLEEAIICYATCEQAIRKGSELLEALDSPEVAEQKNAIKEILRWKNSEGVNSQIEERKS